VSTSIERGPRALARLTCALGVALAAIGCHGARDPAAPDPADRLDGHHAAPVAAPSTPERPRFDRPAMVRFHMQRSFDDLRRIERRLIGGQLDEARALAHLLARPARDPGIDEACRREPRVSAACAGCHLRTGAAPVFPPAPPVPLDRPTRDARMARHLWATDRLWEAMVGGAEPAWRSGLAVLAATPLPFTDRDLSRSARRLQDLARDGASLATAADRAAAYGELLVTCTGCHARVRSAAR
jgi:cytochrome c553